MEPRILQPVRKTLEIKGKIIYREPDQSWNMLKLRRELLAEFPQLKEKRSSFSYQMLFYRTYEEFEKLIRKMKREKLPLPIVLYLVKESEGNQC